MLKKEDITPGLYRRVKVAVINSTIPGEPYHSYGDHWVDGFQDAGCEVRVLRYDEVPLLPLGYDLYFFVEIRYNPESIPWYIYPRALYSWDAHILGADFYRAINGYFNKVCLASKIDVENLNKLGVNNAIWVPEACNPRLHKDLGLPRTFDIGLVGRHNGTYLRNGASKTDFINFLSKSTYKNFFHTELWGKPYVELMNEAVIAFDRTISHNVGTRVFESAAMGCVPLWSDTGISALNGMNELMQDGVHYVSYADTTESITNVVDKLLQDPNRIEQIRTAAKKHVLENHTYANRVVSILNSLGIKYYDIKDEESL
jgi:hypothetical protein